MKKSCVEPYVQSVVRYLNAWLGSAPEGCFNSFKYTRTGTNLCHPLAIGALTAAVAGMDGIALTGVDVRLKSEGGEKFQPDVVGFSERAAAPLICVDFESPNSSDARVPKKDIAAYTSWNPIATAKCPYIIITSLPDAPVSEWELRWTAAGYYNEQHRDAWAEIEKSPWAYWSGVWRCAVREAQHDLSNIGFINIDGVRARPFDLA